jgi:hypothetical protein
VVLRVRLVFRRVNFFVINGVISWRDVFVLRYVFVNVIASVFLRLVCIVFVIRRPVSFALIKTGPH